MKFLQIIFFILFLGCVSQNIFAQACCGFSLSLVIKDIEGSIIKNAKVELYGKKAYFDSQTNSYLVGSTIGVNTKNDSLLIVKAKGFEKFESDFVITCGQFNYELRLNQKGTEERVVFEKLAKISGIITDANGSNIPKIRVVLTSKNSVREETFSNENGYYDFVVKSGIYTLEFAENSEFNSKKTEQIELNKGYNKLDITLINKEEK